MDDHGFMPIKLKCKTLHYYGKNYNDGLHLCLNMRCSSDNNTYMTPISNISQHRYQWLPDTGCYLKQYATCSYRILEEVKLVDLDLSC